MVASTRGSATTLTGGVDDDGHCLRAQAGVCRRELGVGEAPGQIIEECGLTHQIGSRAPS